MVFDGITADDKEVSLATSPSHHNERESVYEQTKELILFSEIQEVGMKANLALCPSFTQLLLSHSIDIKCIIYVNKQK